MRGWGRILLLLGLGLLAGGMLFFGAVMAPLVFTRLPLPVAGVFIREAFPWYFGYCALSAMLAVVGGALSRSRLTLVPLAVLGISAVSAWGLLPLMDALKATHDMRGFAFWHEVSAWTNGAELLAVLLAFIRLAAQGSGREVPLDIADR